MFLQDNFAIRNGTQKRDPVHMIHKWYKTGDDQTQEYLLALRTVHPAQ